MPFPKFDPSQEHIIKTSTGEDLNLKQNKRWFDQKIARLPKKEQTLLNIRYKQYRQYLGRNNYPVDPVTGMRIADMLHAKEDELIELFGRMFTMEQVHEIVTKDWGLAVSYKAIWKCYKRNKDVIAEKIEIHKRDHTVLRLAHRKSRIEEFADLYKPLKDAYMAQPRPQTLQALVQLLEAIRKETDGDILKIDALSIDIDNYVKEHLAKDILKTINIRKAVLTKIAAKNNLNIDVLNFSLESSYYRKLNEMQQGEEVDYELVEDFKYPSEQNYDIRELEPAFAKQEAEVATITKATLVDAHTADELSHIKIKLMAALETKQSDISKKKDIIAAIANAKRIKQKIAEQEATNNK